MHGKEKSSYLAITRISSSIALNRGGVNENMKGKPSAKFSYFSTRTKKVAQQRGKRAKGGTIEKSTNIVE